MEQRQFFLRDILTVIFKHLQLLLFFPVIVLLIVAAASYIWPPTYESVAKVKIMRGREVSQADPTVTANAQSVMLMQLGVEDVNSEIELLHSQDVLRKTVKACEPPLDQDPGFPYGKGPLAQFIKGLRFSIRGVMYYAGLSGKRDAEQVAMEDLAARVITRPIRDSYVIEVAVRMGDKEKAQHILEKLLEVYKQHHIEIYRNEKSAGFFDKRLTDAETELRQAQKELEAFRNENEISLLDTQKELLLATYTDALRVLSQLEEANNLITGNPDAAMISSLASETDSTVVREMQLRLLELLLERNRVSKSLGANHSTLQGLNAQVEDAQVDLLEAIGTTRQLTETKKNSALEELRKLNKTKAELDEKEKKVELLQANFDLYWEKREESRVADALAMESFSNIQVASNPSMPIDPVFPRKLFNIVLALFGGVIGALALAFFLDYLDHGLKTPEDIEYFVKLAPLASFFNRAGEKLDKREAERLAIVLDAFHGSGGSNVFQVVSSVPGEGAPQVAMSIAEAYANDPEGKTVLIDLTGEAGGGRATGAGITDCLLNQASLDDVFGTGDGLNVVGAGSHGASATYLWGTEQMQHLIEELRRRYKYIVFNVGPVLRSHDALKLARCADGIVMVIRADATRREVVSRALDLYGSDRHRVVGAVLTERTQKIPQAVYRRI